MNATARRYEALDSLRGVCACVVAYFHFPTGGVLTNLAVVRNGWLFVDFFFVLSGFVIASAYFERLRAGYPAWKYMALRLGRIWPLHLFVLALYLMLELALASGVGGPAVSRGAFEGGHRPIELLATALLTNAHGLFTHLSWNNPSWSIGAEFWTYGVFALLVAIGGRGSRLLFGLAAIGALWTLAILSPRWLDATYDFGFVRCVYGFSIGVLLHPLVARNDGKAIGRIATPLELGLVLACIAFVSWAKGPATLAAPVLFAAAIYVFACEAGAVSRVLRTKPFLLVGGLSYSIYLLHAFIQGRVVDLIQIVDASAGTDLLGRGGGEAGVMPDLIAILMLAIVIAAAGFSYRFIELPGRRWTRARVNGNGATEAAEARAPTF